MHKVSMAAALALSLSTAAAAALAQPALETDQEKTLYALGVALGDNIRQFDLSAAELATVAAGINDAALGNEFKVDMEVYGPKIQELLNERTAARATVEKEASAAFVYELAQEAGAERSVSGMVYVPVTVGTGASPTATDTVRVHYHGTLRDGTVFDSSVERGEPISFSLNGVIPCWTEGVQKMKVGGKAKLACPSDTAYGDAGQGPIPGGAALLFEVELLAIEAAE
ncbi:MAG TPA: FKBP-type peptidyl-prolyl cis-trans isomerase [Gammaproteobacteria bacterium]